MRLAVTHEAVRRAVPNRWHRSFDLVCMFSAFLAFLVGLRSMAVRARLGGAYQRTVFGFSEVSR